MATAYLKSITIDSSLIKIAKRDREFSEFSREVNLCAPAGGRRNFLRSNRLLISVEYKTARRRLLDECT